MRSSSNPSSSCRLHPSYRQPRRNRFVRWISIGNAVVSTDVVVPGLVGKREEIIDLRGTAAFQNLWISDTALLLLTPY